jgi:hypothetical protein
MPVSESSRHTETIWAVIWEELLALMVGRIGHQVAPVNRLNAYPMRAGN